MSQTAIVEHSEGTVLRKGIDTRIHALAGAIAWGAVLGLTGCGGNLPEAPLTVSMNGAAVDQTHYRIGPLDAIQIVVWQAPEFSVSVPIRPDGKISMPLIEDIQAAGKTPTELGRTIEERLKKYIENPVATVMVNSFVGNVQQVRVVGQATKPRAIPYRADMTVLDLMIEVGGLTEFADGNRAVLVRHTAEGEKSYNVRIDSLLKNGDIRSNVPVQPGDVLIIPETWF
ncbi:XrtA/PEP-CTERM system exopolysaccharide export protein [Azospirillum canadense]|uniref:XrtA/PEP-CTERM system exopolysaccharide export protein n=1 Tax=Azospirillum canadense TaxID=403962 RepID=UPI0022266829|nr:XrtA/PEP-CTERM system exopolysaccharide export protein [Azospirillum canadense]MCW2240900.1 polysaccharide export outer membrane protein [Azospirillum canadense]